MVLTAFVVASGNRGRREVIAKSGLRVAGAAGGTVFATVLAGAFVPDDHWAIVAIFAALGLACWLREFSYGYWAAGVTAALALLYDYFGEHGPGLLVTRLGEIVIGAIIAVTASWFIAPVKGVHAMPAERRGAVVTGYGPGLGSRRSTGSGRDHGLILSGIESVNRASTRTVLKRRPGSTDDNQSTFEGQSRP